MELSEGGWTEREQRPDARGSIWPALRSAAGGLVAAAGVVLILAAAVLLGLQDESLVAGVTSTPTVTATPSPVRPSPTLIPAAATATNTPRPSPTPTSTPSATPALPTATPSPSPSPTPTETARVAQDKRSTSTTGASARCTPNPGRGWHLYTVKSGESLRSLANRFGVSMQRLMEANCLSSTSIRSKQRLWVPYVAPTLKSVPPQKPRPTATRIRPKRTATSVPYGGGVLVPPDLDGESPLPSTRAPARLLSVAATVLSLIVMALVRLAANRRAIEQQCDGWHYAHGLQGYAPREQHEAGSLSH